MRIYTAQYRYAGADRFDVTVKGQDPLGKFFAPTWNMVMGVKNGTMTEHDQQVVTIATGLPWAGEALKLLESPKQNRKAPRLELRKP